MLEEYTAPFRAKSEVETGAAIQAKIEGREAEVRKYMDELPALGLMSGFSVYKGTEEGKHPSSETLAMYESQYFHFVDWMKEHHPEVEEMRNVSRRIAREFDEHLEREFSINSRKKYLSLLSLIWKAIASKEEDEAEDRKGPILKREVAAGLARFEDNPWIHLRDKVKTSRGDQFRRRALTIEEIGKIINSQEGEMRLLFIIGAYTGQRLGDCALLEWSGENSAIDLIRGILTIRPRKTKRKLPEPKVFHLHRRLYAELSSVPESGRRGYVLPKIAKWYLQDDSSLCSAIGEVFAKNGIQTQVKDSKTGRAKTIVGFHSLRHFTATWLFERGKEGQASYVLGHSSPDTTKSYNHPRQIALKETIESFPDMGAPSGSGEVIDAACVDLVSLYAMLDKVSMDELRKIEKYIKRRIGK